MPLLREITALKETLQNGIKIESDTEAANDRVTVVDIHGSGEEENTSHNVLEETPKLLLASQ